MIEQSTSTSLSLKAGRGQDNAQTTILTLITLGCLKSTTKKPWILVPMFFYNEKKKT